MWKKTVVYQGFEMCWLGVGRVFVTRGGRRRWTTFGEKVSTEQSQERGSVDCVVTKSSSHSRKSSNPVKRQMSLYFTSTALLDVKQDSWG